MTATLPFTASGLIKNRGITFSVQPTGTAERTEPHDRRLYNIALPYPSIKNGALCNTVFYLYILSFFLPFVNTRPNKRPSNTKKRRKSVVFSPKKRVHCIKKSPAGARTPAGDRKTSKINYEQSTHPTQSDIIAERFHSSECAPEE